MGEIQQNSNAIAQDLKSIIQKVRIAKIFAIITDNAAVMKKAWRILKKDYLQFIFLNLYQ